MKKNKATDPEPSAKLDCGGIQLDLTRPVVMGILNITPDSFYDGGAFLTEAVQVRQVEKMLKEGALLIDIGAVSTRPGADPVSEKDEINKLIPTLKIVKRCFPKTIFSVDTYRSAVARAAIENGAGMINDIYGGRFDGKIIRVVSGAGIPYILMHMQGTPSDMQINPRYGSVVEEVIQFFRQQMLLFPKKFGKILLDPGFGFGKSLEHNFQLLASLDKLKQLGCPIVAGISRKSMINRVLQTRPAEALNGTTVLNTIALTKGAGILRVHDVREANQAITLVEALKNSTSSDQ